MILQPIWLKGDSRETCFIYVIACVGIAILAASILPVLKAGVEKWTSYSYIENFWLEIFCGD